MRAAALLASLVVVALTGCTQTTSSSSGDFQGEKLAVANKIGDLSDDGRRKKADQICANDLSKELIGTVAAAGSSCESEMKKAIDDADDFDLDVKSVTIDGDTATARVESTDGDKTVARTFQLVREDGSWRIRSFG